MTTIAHPSVPSVRRRGRKLRVITDEERAVLADVFLWVRTICTEDGRFRPKQWADRLCWPKTGKHKSDVPACFQHFSRSRRPWSDAAIDLAWVILTSVEMDTRTGRWSLRRSIEELRWQMKGCSRSRVESAIAEWKDSPVPLLQIDATTRYVAGQRFRGALTFSAVLDPFAFATARDLARVPRQTAEDARRAALHYDLVKLQAAHLAGEITAGEHRTRRELINRQIKWGPSPPPLVAVDALCAAPAPIPHDISPATNDDAVLSGRALWEAFRRLQEAYPKSADLEADERRRAREWWECLRPTVAFTDRLLLHLEQRARLPRSSGGWSDVEPRYRPDLFTFLRDELWKAGVVADLT